MSPQTTISRFIALSALFLLIGCDACDPNGEPPADAGQASGDGTLVQGGEEKAYRMNVDESYLRIMVEKKSGPCSAFHDHAVEARGVTLSFYLDEDDLGASNIIASVPAAALEPDSPESRDTFDKTRGSRISDSDREKIYGSVQGEILGGQHPTLSFEVTGLPAIEGSDLSATIEATIAGQTSSIEMTYNASFEGDVLTIDATGTIDGSEHGMMRATLSKQCSKAAMPMALKLVLEPGSSDGPQEFDAGEPYEQQYFPYEGGCDDDVGYVEVSDVLVRRCAGCHSEDSTFPLTAYEDWRYDSITSQGKPLYETAWELLVATDGLLMPPLFDSTPLPAEDLALAQLWIEKGAPEEKCSPEPLTPFVPAQQADCGDTNYLEDIKPMIDQNCVFCHDGIYHPLSLVSYEDGMAGMDTAEHFFYQPLTPWEVSVERVADGTMPPTGGGLQFFYSGVFEDDLAILREWVDLGYPKEPCDTESSDGGVETDGGMASDGGVSTSDSGS